MNVLREDQLTSPQAPPCVATPARVNSSDASPGLHKNIRPFGVECSARTSIQAMLPQQ